MHDATAFVGEAVRKVYDRDSESLKKQGIEFACTLIFGGQIRGERCRLFQVYSAGNFIEAQDENLYFQIGESKYGKPIIDRVVTPATTLDEAAKCALVSMDSTLRSNLSAGLPLDLLCYEADSLRVTRFVTITPANEYFHMLSRTWGQPLKQAVVKLPSPTFAEQPRTFWRLGNRSGRSCSLKTHRTRSPREDRPRCRRGLSRAWGPATRGSLRCRARAARSCSRCIP